MNEIMRRFDRKMDAHRLLMRAGAVILATLVLIIMALLMDAGIQDNMHG